MPSPPASPCKRIKGQNPPRSRVTTARRNETAEPELKRGDIVVVFAINSFGPHIEGTGIIEACDLARGRYHIKFAGDPTPRLRFINPDWQALPKISLALLRDFWRSQSEREPVIEDFFPD